MKDEERDEYDGLAEASILERLVENWEILVHRCSSAGIAIVKAPLRWFGIAQEEEDYYSETVGLEHRPRRAARWRLPSLPSLPLGRWNNDGFIEFGEDDDLGPAKPGILLRVRFALEALLYFAIVVPFFAGVDFLQSWMFTRNYRKLLLATPAVLLFVFAACFAVLSLASSPRKLAAHYRVAAAAAIDSGDYEAASLCQEKLEQLEPSNRHDAYWAADRLAEAGEPDEALKRMQQLAPLDGVGFVPAHLWIAHGLLTNRVSGPSGDPQKLIKAHLDRVLSRDPKNAFALNLLAEHLAAQGATTEAVAAFEQVKPSSREGQLEYDMRIADLHFRAGDIAKSNEIQRKWVDELSRRFQRGKLLSADSFAYWARAQVQLGDREDCVRIYQLGIEQHPDDERLKEAYYAACVELQEMYIARGDHQKHLALLRRMSEFEPTETQVAVLIAEACGVEAIFREAEDLLQPQLRQGKFPADVYEKLANAALTRGNHVEARRLYNQLLKINAKRPLALNNLAWMLAHNEPVSFERALTLIDQAIVIDPSSVAYRGTRGMILMKLERWQEATEDLASAVNGNPLHATLYHEALATAYAKIGKHELSVHHRKRSTTSTEPVGGGRAIDAP